MKIRSIITLTMALALSGAVIALAQDDNSTDESVNRITKRSASSRKQDSNVAPGQQITQRMQTFYEHKEISDADLEYMRVIYRQLDVTKKKNGALYYPVDPTPGQQNLFRIIMRMLVSNQLTAYEYLDGREIFTDRYKIDVKETLERFNILYKEARSSTPKNPRYTIHESDVPANEVLSYYIIEKWEFDRVTNEMHTRVEAICPVLHRTDDYGYDTVKYPMFWVKYDSLRPALSQQAIFTDDDNNLTRYTYDDFFNLGMYDGEIYKTLNLQNKSMAQLYPNPTDLKHAQDSIDNRLRNYGKNLWVPTREELAAKRAKEDSIAAASDTLGVTQSDKQVQKKSTRTSRSARGNSNKSNSTKATKTKKVKLPKVQAPRNEAANSGAARSVRRRK